MKALTIFLKTIWFLAITTLSVTIIFYLLSKRIRISIHKCQYGMISFFSINLKVMTSSTITSITNLIQSETITIKFKTFCFFTITNNFFRVALFKYRSWFTSFFVLDLFFFYLCNGIWFLILRHNFVLTDEGNFLINFLGQTFNTIILIILIWADFWAG